MSLHRQNLTAFARAALAGAVLAALTGCAVQQPDIGAMTASVTPKAWSASSLPEGDLAAMEDFWRRWNDESLEALVSRAQAVNTDVLAAAASLRSARASLLSANALLWPSASVQADGSRNRAAGMTTESYSLGGSADWTINLAGSQIFSSDAASLEALASELTLEDVRESVAAETAQAYINLRAAQQQYRIVEASILNYEQTAQVSRWKYEAGTGSASDLEDALSQLATQRASLPQIKESIVQYQNALARLTSLPVDALPISAQESLPVPPSGCAVSLPASLLERRPDLQSAKRSLEAAVLRLRSAKSDFFPTLSLSGNIGTAAATVGALGASGTGIAGLVGALSMPVLNWGSLMAAQETAAAELDRQRANYVSVLLQALEQTDNALTGISSAERRKDDLTTALTHAANAEKLSRLEYETGIGDYSMLLTTQRSLLTAQEAVLTNNASLANNFVMLYRALGGGWPIRQTDGKTAAVQTAQDEQMALTAQKE